MGRNRRDRRQPNQMVVHITNRVWEGLPFVPNRTMRRMIRGVMARGQNLYPVTICLYLFMTNHYHMILAGDGKRISRFIGYIEAEIARRLIRLLPLRWGPRFWESRFREEHLPTSEAVINKITYIICNPLRARLVGELKDYPGASSLQSLNNANAKTEELCSFTFSRYFPRLTAPRLSSKSDIRLSQQLHRQSSGFYALKTDLFAWVKCLRSNVQRTDVLVRIRGAVQEAERIARSQGVIGAERLGDQSFSKPHRPKKTGYCPIISCPDKKLRKHLIESYKNFCAECAKAWKQMKQGLVAIWPRGAYIPSCFNFILSGSTST